MSARRQGGFRHGCGRPILASFAMLESMAIIEVAQAAGLSLLSSEERNPLLASSRGVGELIMAAYGQGCRHFIVGLGGSATCDGGAGLLEVPGIKQLKNCSFELLCDVDTPFTGPRGAVRVFAPQKGASADDIPVLEERMERMADTLFYISGLDVRALPGAGAAGGLGGAFMACFLARMQRGIDRILEWVHFDQALSAPALSSREKDGPMPRY